MRLTCDVIVLSSTTMLASRIRLSRSFTCPGKRASACTIQNSVSVRSTRAPFQSVMKRLMSIRSGPRWSTSSVEGGDCSKSLRRKMRQAHVFRQVIVSAQTQSGDYVEVGVARGQEDDRQRRRQRAQFATK